MGSCSYALLCAFIHLKFFLALKILKISCPWLKKLTSYDYLLEIFVLSININLYYIYVHYRRRIKNVLAYKPPDNIPSHPIPLLGKRDNFQTHLILGQNRCKSWKISKKFNGVVYFLLWATIVVHAIAGSIWFRTCNCKFTSHINAFPLFSTADRATTRYYQTFIIA
jgi:hypothetical protein